MSTRKSRAAERATLSDRITACELCPRLREHCREVARVKRRAYRDETYWGRPVPSFGAEDPRLLVVGLAPGAHGANRTGRVFTGDSSGDWLYRELFAAGFANQETSVSRGDGLSLVDAAVTCAVRCAPPGNRPSAEERATCRRWLVEEIRSSGRLAVVIALGRIAFDDFRKAWAEARPEPWERRPEFAHGAEVATAGRSLTLITSYHPSRQNTQTGRLTRAMFRKPFARARRLLDRLDRAEPIRSGPGP